MGNPLRAVRFDEKTVDAIFNEVDQCQYPGAAVGIAVNGHVLYRQGFGLASMELPVVLSPTIRMRIGSTTKHFAALSYMLLCEEGRAELDEPIGSYLPELHPASRGVTARQLMGNVSGLRDALDICWHFSGTGTAVSSSELLRVYRDIDDVNAPPGTAWIYNNGGWQILSAVIERIADKPLEEVLRERVFEPIGMYDTLLRRFDTDFVPNSACLHMSKADGGFEKSYLGTALAGEGGVVSTIDDMLRWLAHMSRPTVGSLQTWSSMQTPQQLANGCSTGYGLGLTIGEYRGVRTISHSGGVLGGNSQMLKAPELGLDIVIMVNRHDVLGMALTTQILDACIDGLEQSQVDGVSPNLEGVFRSTTTGRVVQLSMRDGVQTASVDGMDLPVVADERGVLLAAGIASSVKMTIEAVGSGDRPAAIFLRSYGDLDQLARVRLMETPATARMLGRYMSESSGTEAIIAEDSVGLTCRTKGWFGSATYQLNCLGDGIWRMSETGPMQRGGVLSFDDRQQAFSFSNLRTWRLQFRRVV